MNENFRLAQMSNLRCALAKRFSSRPLVYEAAAALLAQQWRERHLSTRHSPLQMLLVSTDASGSRNWIRPLSHVLVERFCRRKTLNLTPAEDFLTLDPGGRSSTAIEIDLHPIELLINECGPFLIASYQQALIGYWCAFDSNAETPWQWYSHSLSEQMRSTIQGITPTADLPDYAIATAELVRTHPWQTQALPWANSQNIKVSNLEVDFSAQGKLDVDLTSALLIEDTDSATNRSLTLLYTLSGRLLPFQSRQALLSTLQQEWPAQQTPFAREIHLTPAAGQIFETQAQGLLRSQLRLIEHTAAQYTSQRGGLAMTLDIDHLTSMLEFCNLEEHEQRKPLMDQLPDWLRNANSKNLLRYSQMLVDVAQGYHEVEGKFWLDDVPSAESFTYKQLAQRLAVDHPAGDLEPQDLRILNLQTTASAIAGQDGLITGGSVTPVELTFAQLAIGNLGLLKPGRVELSLLSGKPLPAWMDTTYLRTLVRELDIGSAYPKLLAQKLLDDPLQRAERQNLLGAQLSKQLPALAMELRLRGRGISDEAVQGIAHLFQGGLDEHATRWVMRPLGFIKSAGSTPDHPYNTWLIEGENPSTTPCLLYRPLHQDSLLEFADRLALFAAISTAGDLQDNLIHRLAPEDRHFYAHGGFLEPHLFFAIDDPWSVPFGTPAPVALSVEAAVEDLAQTLYLDCANESIRRFREHASTSAEARWNSWKELGLLLFNTLLPLAGSTLGKVAWLAQMEVAIAQYIATDPDDDASNRRIALVNLLVNISILIFTHSLKRLRLEAQDEQAPIEPAQTSTPEPLPMPAVTWSPARLTSVVDDHWSSPQSNLSAAQLQALTKLQAEHPPEHLGSPIPHGPLMGLYLHDSTFWFIHRDKVYRVSTDLTTHEYRIVGDSDDQLGPWLRRDDVGRWQLDLSLRLRGGQPLGKRIRQLQLKNEQELTQLDGELKTESVYANTQIKHMQLMAQDIGQEAAEPLLRDYLDKMQTFSGFWEGHLAKLIVRNEKQAVRDFKGLKARAVYQRSRCELSILTTLKKLYKPVHTQITEIIQRSPLAETLSAEDRSSLGAHLDAEMSLLDQLLKHSETQLGLQTTLKSLSSQNNPTIKALLDSIDAHLVDPNGPLYWRFMRMLSLATRIDMLSPLEETAVFELRRATSNLELAISQRLHLLRLETNNIEFKVRLLRSNEQQLSNSARQLGLLQQLLDDAPTLQNLNTLQRDVTAVIDQVHSDLAEYPDYPPTNTVAQLRKSFPGLVETDDQGLLLGTVREDDQTTVDIPGAEGPTPARTYRDGAQVPSPAASVAARPLKSLKRLLKDSNSLMTKARSQLQRLQQLVAKTSSDYPPVEFEELLHRDRDELRRHSQAIQHRLTVDNDTDAATEGQDAAIASKALDDLAQTLDEKGLELRTAAALQQKPRMGELQYLLDKNQVQVRRLKKTHLPKAKDRLDDYLEEYAISHQGQDLWFAHFHYPSDKSPRDAFVAGHLKSAEQRLDKGRYKTDASGKQVEVYRAPITLAAAQQVFFAE